MKYHVASGFQYIDPPASACISVISVTELLAKPSLTEHQESVISKFLHQFHILDIDPLIAQKAAYLKKQYGLTFPDALLAATAQVFQMPLVSKDKIFRKIEEITVIAE